MCVSVGCGHFSKWSMSFIFTIFWLSLIHWRSKLRTVWVLSFVSNAFKSQQWICLTVSNIPQLLIDYCSCLKYICVWLPGEYLFGYWKNTFKGKYLNWCYFLVTIGGTAKLFCIFILIITGVLRQNQTNSGPILVYYNSQINCRSLSISSISQLGLGLHVLSLHVMPQVELCGTLRSVVVSLLWAAH